MHFGSRHFAARHFASRHFRRGGGGFTGAIVLAVSRIFSGLQVGDGSTSLDVVAPDARLAIRVADGRTRLDVVKPTTWALVLLE